MKKAKLNLKPLVVVKERKLVNVMMPRKMISLLIRIKKETKKETKKGTKKRMVVMLLLKLKMPHQKKLMKLPQITVNSVQNKRNVTRRRNKSKQIYVIENGMVKE